MSNVAMLKAMARNYDGRKQLWDRLDIEACIKAANEIEQLTAKIAELEEENARLKAESRDACLGLNDYYGRKLSAEQLNNKRLREALQAMVNSAADMNCGLKIADDALSLPASRKTLDKYVADAIELERTARQQAEALLHKQAETIAVLNRQRDLAVSAIENLVKQKGRHNTEIAYKKLVDVLAAIKESGATK